MSDVKQASFGLAATLRKQPSTSATNKVADAVGANNNSLVQIPPGTVYRDGLVWPVDKEWHGRELTEYTIRRSQWTKTLQINLYVALSSEPGNLCAFQVHADPSCTDEEARQQAQVWMMVLNMHRKEK